MSKLASWRPENVGAGQAKVSAPRTLGPTTATTLGLPTRSSPRPATPAAVCHSCGGLPQLRRPATPAAACHTCRGLPHLRKTGGHPPAGTPPPPRAPSALQHWRAAPGTRLHHGTPRTRVESNDGRRWARWQAVPGTRLWTHVQTQVRQVHACMGGWLPACVRVCAALLAMHGHDHAANPVAAMASTDALAPAASTRSASAGSLAEPLEQCGGISGGGGGRGGFPRLHADLPTRPEASSRAAATDRA